MKNRLISVLTYRLIHYGGENGKVLEVMAGQGWNYEVLNEFFGEVEMLEQLAKVATYINKSVKTHI